MPNRIIKESICTSETLAGLSEFQENFFYHLIVSVDDYGRLDARPAILKAKLFPLRERLALRDVEGALRALADAGCVEVYEVDGRPYLCLPTWEVHQRVRNKRSKYPAPSDWNTLTFDGGLQTNAPVIQSNPKPESLSESEAKSRRAGGLSAAVSAYLDRVNPSASQQSLEELKAFSEVLGPEVCIRAMDLALDEKKATWSYIRGILRRFQSQGVKCLADIARGEAEREREKSFVKKDPKSGYFGGKADPSALKGDMDWMDRFLEKQEGQ